MVAERRTRVSSKAAHTPRVSRKAAHTHSWIIGKPDGLLSEGVCKSCGARRDFVATVRRSMGGGPRPLQSLSGTWLNGNGEAGGRVREGGMATTTDDDERQAQRIALQHLIKGCDDAVSGLLRSAGNGKGKDQPASTRRAREILAEMLSSWRQTLNAIGPPE